jgi:hypothetical protein
MQTTADRLRRQTAVLMTLLQTMLLVLASCAGSTTEVSSTFDLAPFREMAKSAGCADIRNRLFLIDDQIVFWDIEGNCSDAAYNQTLFGTTPDQVLCIFHDSIAGPVKDCPDESYQDLFDLMTANLDKPDLGLGPEHTVEPVPF